jgi:hypothetical protein
MNFDMRVAALEKKFRERAEAEDSEFLPNFTPAEPVDAVLIGMEPSLGRWARTRAEARRRVADGFRNFMWSPEDFVLHYAVRRSLCATGGTYHITDISKGAMLVEKANVGRRERYDRWADLLKEEIELVSKPDARIFAIGKAVHNFVSRHISNHDVAQVMHYSPLASAARNTAIRGREIEFAKFADALSVENLVSVAQDLMTENRIPPALVHETIARLRKAGLSESLKKLAFVYVADFAKVRADLRPHNA